MVADDKQSHALDRQHAFRSLYLHMVEAVALNELLCDEHGHAVNYRILEANPQFRRCFALEGGPIAGKLATEVFAVAEPPLLGQLAPAAQGGQPAHFESRFVAPDRCYEISVVPLGSGYFATLFLDITERKRGEDALRASEEIFRRVFELFPGPVTLAEVDGTIIDCNQDFCRATGLTREQIIGHKTSEFSTWLDPAQRVAMYERAAQGQAVDWLELKLRRTDGEIHNMQISCRPFVMGGRTVVLAAGRDITELRTLEAKMLQTQKLESLGVMAGGIAHDFNNLLTGILGNADLARAEVPAQSSARDCLEGIETAARRAADLCRQMLAYSGRGRFVVEPVNLQELVEQMGHLLSVSVGKKVELRYRFAEGLPSIEADASQLRQAIMNLVINGAEAIGERSGVVTVAVGRAACDVDTLKGCIGAGTLRPGEYVFVEVADTGSGIGSDQLGRIFDPFFSTKFTGRGLGLPAVLGIVRGYHGAIKVDSPAGKGTTFRLLFPVTQKVVRTRETKAVAPTPAKLTGTILLADDEETIRTLGRRMLQNVGFEVVTAADGRDAIDKFAANRERIDLVILDLTMPHYDGESCYLELCQLKPGVKVILCSGYDEQAIVSRFSGRGLAGFVQKPYTSGELLARIREALAK